METRSSKMDETNLSEEEIEIVMKALGFYQIHLLDEMSQQGSGDEDLELQVRLISIAIKKLHKLYEKMSGTMHAKEI